MPAATKIDVTRAEQVREELKNRKAEQEGVIILLDVLCLWEMGGEEEMGVLLVAVNPISELHFVGRHLR